MAVNLKTIAKLAGVSVATVSRVINKSSNVKEATRKKVQKVIDEYNFIPNATAKSLKINDTKSVAFLIPDVTNSFFTEVLGGVEDVCTKEGYNILIATSDESKGKEKKLLQVLLQNRVSGILAAFADSDNELIDSFKLYSIPIVCIDRNPFNRNDLDCVLTDNERCLDDMIRYLVELGHTRIAMILGDDSIPPGYERNIAFKNAMHKYNLECTSEYMQQGYFTLDDSYKAAERLLALDIPPTAIITSSNYSTMGVYMALQDNGVKIGEEISLLGFDDFLLASHLNPPITVMKKPNKDIGRMAAKMLIDRINKNNDNPDEKQEYETIRFPMEMVIRASCKDMNHGQ